MRIGFADEFFVLLDGQIAKFFAVGNFVAFKIGTEQYFVAADDFQGGIAAAQRIYPRRRRVGVN